ncbi:MobF family relaxase [Wenjunlia tyrosinilytica]|uniref:MobF family relaxase n=1 Tax=Wenjunlia tyrosinilytica TaxID=1544741 RepID=UPI0016693830
MISIAKVAAGAGWRYYFRGVMAGDGPRPAGKALRAAQEEAGVPPGRWTGRGPAALGLASGETVTERQAELLLGEGRHPDADRIERELQAAGADPAAVRRATVLARPIEHIDSPVLAVDLVFRAPPTAHALWALADDATRRVLEECHEIARDGTLARLEESVARVRWGSGGGHQAPVKDGLVVAVFRHHESRSGRPLLHDHAVLSVKVRRPDGTWGNLATADLFENVVAADALYTLLFMEEVSARLGVAWEPREVTPGKRPVMEIAGVPHELIGWQSTRRQQIEHAYEDQLQQYRSDHGHEPGERARYKLALIAADRTRPPKGIPRTLPELRERWRRSAVHAVGADVVDRLLETARAAATAVWARVRPVVDLALAAVETVAVVYVMRGAFQHRHLLAEARRHLTYVLRGRRHEPGLDEAIVRAAVDGCTRPVGRALTADFRYLYPRESDGRAVVRPLTRHRTASRYERARLAGDALTTRVRASRRSRRLASRSLPHAVAIPAAPPREGSHHGREKQQTTDLAAAEDTRRFILTAARLRGGVKERAASDPPARPAAPTKPPHTQQSPGPVPGRGSTPGRTV